MAFQKLICFAIAFAIGLNISSLRDSLFVLAGLIVGSMATYHLTKE